MTFVDELRKNVYMTTSEYQIEEKKKKIIDKKEEYYQEIKKACVKGSEWGVRIKKIEIGKDVTSTHFDYIEFPEETYDAILKIKEYLIQRLSEDGFKKFNIDIISENSAEYEYYSRLKIYRRRKIKVNYYWLNIIVEW